jgi:capsular polysaccharide biosynthesis protein
MEINLKDILYILRKKVWVIILITLSTTILTAIINFYVLEPVYKADTMLYVVRDVTSGEEMVYKDLLMSRQIVNDYRELAKSRLVEDVVFQQLNLKDITHKEYTEMLRVNSKNDTRMIEISVEYKDPELAKDIANKVAEVFMPKAVELINVVDVEMVDVAITPEEPLRPKKLKNIAIATIMMFMLSILLVFILEYAHKTLKSNNLE